MGPMTSTPEAQSGQIAGTDSVVLTKTTGEPPPTSGHERFGPKRGPLPVMALAALGVVFGDVGTSPLYALAAVFSADDNFIKPDTVDVYGVISLVFWSVTIIVSVKYLMLVMRADNDGEGGILALVALLRDKLHDRQRLVGAATMMGIIGAALFYGDSIITPAMSVMSAIEGLAVVNEGAENYVVPASLVILTILFAGQRFGTAKIGRFFGPIMFLWFSCLAILGIPHIVAHPAILGAISPHFALQFGLERPVVFFIAIGATVLCITGSEALYADMGHFGKRPIQTAWFFLVFPALMLNYFGQGALILNDPEAITNPFFQMAPSWAVIPLVVLATTATVIASQSVISGAYSISRQAARLGLLPRLNVRHTSKEESGQIYIAMVNWILFGGVVTLILAFKSSGNLANAYGLAVTGTLLLTTSIFLWLARYVWQWAVWKMLLATFVFAGLEAIYLLANLTKLWHGGWLPVLVAIVVVAMMTTWQRGVRERHATRSRLEGSLADFIERMRVKDVPRVEGVAVYPHRNQVTVPLALKENLRFNKVLPTVNVLVTIINENIPHVRHAERAIVNDLGYDDDGFFHVTYRVGFNDSQDIPKALTWAKELQQQHAFDPKEARYFLSSLRLGRSEKSCMSKWRRELFLMMSAAEANRTAVFHLPVQRTIIIGAQADL